MAPVGAPSSTRRLDDFDSKAKSYPKEGTGIYKRIEDVQQRETDIINDFIADEIKKDGIDKFDNQQKLIEYMKHKIRRELLLTYGINLNQNN